jgi:predicted nucleic acid-binding protein
LTSIFADSGYYVALLLQTDQAHDRAVEITQQLQSPIITTAWVLTEVANTFSAPQFRGDFISLLDDLQADPNVRLIAPDATIFGQGIELYRNRPDKSWSLTDCISFVVMEREEIKDALTGDRHFEQAGFNALLR